MYLLINWLLLSCFAGALTQSQPAIQDNWQYVALIRTDAIDPKDGVSVPSYCNATLLNGNTLLTAAHCLQDAFVIKSYQAQIQIGLYKFVTRADGKVVRVGYINKIKELIPAQFYFPAHVRHNLLSQGLHTSLGPDDDVAVLVLQKPLTLPADFQFAKLASRSEVQLVANQMAAYLPSTVTINFMAEMSADIKRMSALDSISFDGAGYFTSKSQSRVEEGDSGAPLFVRLKNEWKIVAIVKGRATTFFSNWDVFSAVGNATCDIASQVSDPVVRELLCR